MKGACFPCHVCGAEHVQEFSAFRKLPGVASDSRPWASGARLGQCEKCGCVVKDISSSWKDSVAQIYDTYRIYHQSKGAEKLNFDGSDPRASPRSQRLLEALFDLTGSGRLKTALDVGTGTGAMLCALSEMAPGMALWGQDLSDKEQMSLRKISDFQGLFVRPLTDISGSFDLVTMVHVLEHVPDPISFLHHAKSLLSQDGLLLVNVPDAIINPIDLLVTDHCTHFTLQSLLRVAQAAGLRAVLARDDMLDKELVLIAAPGDDVEGIFDADLSDRATTRNTISKHVDWLDHVLQQGRALLDHSVNSVFGASLAGAWLGGALEGWQGSFVDEDRNRVGNSLLDHSIILPDQLPSGRKVFVPLAPHLAQRIASRLTTPQTPYIVPGAF